MTRLSKLNTRPITRDDWMRMAHFARERAARAQSYIDHEGNIWLVESQRGREAREAIDDRWMSVLRAFERQAHPVPR